MADLVDEFRGIEVLEGIPKRHLKRLAAVTELREADKGDVLVREGTHSREFFIVLSGSAAVSVRGRRRDTVSRGGFFGEIALLNRSARTATITALSPMRLAVIGAQDFQHLLESEPRFAVHMTQGLARRLEFLTRKPTGELR